MLLHFYQILLLNQLGFENQHQKLEVVDQLKELNNLYDKGIINDDEFKKAKDKILK